MTIIHTNTAESKVNWEDVTSFLIPKIKEFIAHTRDVEKIQQYSRDIDFLHSAAELSRLAFVANMTRHVEDFNEYTQKLLAAESRVKALLSLYSFGLPQPSALVVEKEKTTLNLNNDWEF